MIQGYYKLQKAERWPAWSNRPSQRECMFYTLKKRIQCIKLITVPACTGMVIRCSCFTRRCLVISVVIRFHSNVVTTAQQRGSQQEKSRTTDNNARCHKRHIVRVCVVCEPSYNTHSHPTMNKKISKLHC